MEMDLLAFKPAHNVPAKLSAEHDADFAPIISFLQRSRYLFALTVQPLVYESHHQQFWASCSVSSSSNGRTLVATIDAHPVSINVETICRHLRLNDAGGKVSFTKDEVASTFQSMGYEGPLPSTTYLKGRVSYNYKYLIHLFLHCLSNKAGGWDQIPSDLASAIHGLVSNQLFNFSVFIFNNLVDNISSPKKFCMYPRFLQQIFNEELGTSLTLTGNTYKMPLVSSKVFVQLKKKGAQFSGKFTPLLPSMESHTPEGDSSVNPTEAEPTPSTSAPSTDPKKKKVKRTAKGTVLPKVKATPLVDPQVLPLEPVAALNQPESPQLMSQNISENIQRDNPILGSALTEATQLDQRLSPKSPGSYHPEMPPTHTFTQAQGASAASVEEPLSPTTQTLMRVVTQLQARFPDPEPILSEVGPSSSEGVNAGEAATTVDLNQDPQDSGTGNRTSPAATFVGEDFFEALLNEGNPGSQETTSGGGEQELTAKVVTLQARVASLEAEVAALQLEIQNKDAAILDLKRRPPNAPSAGSGPEAREEEGAQEVIPSIVTLTAEWDDFLGTYFQVSSTSSSSSSEDTREVAKETEKQTTNVSLEPQSLSGTKSQAETHLSPSGTKSPSETAAQVAMEEATQEEPIFMEPVSPSGTKAAEDLSSSPEPLVETNKESSKVIGQMEETVNAEVNSEAAAASEGPVIIDDSSTEELSANEPTEEEAEQEERIPKKIKGRPDTSVNEEHIRLCALLEEKGYNFDEVFLWSVPRLAAELDKVQQQEQAAAASKAQTVLTKKQKEKAYRDKNEAFLLEYGFHARQLGPMKNSTMDMHIRDIKAKISRGELLPIEQIRAQKASLIRGLGLGEGVRIEFPLSGAGIRQGEEVMCGEVTKAMFPNMFPINPKEEQPSPPSSPSMDNMPISSVFKGTKTAGKLPSQIPDPERQTQADERRTEPSVTEDVGSQPTAKTSAAVGSSVEDQQARDQRSQATAQTRPRFTRKKSIARRKKRTSAISSDSKPESPPPGSKAKPGASMPKDHPKDLYDSQHHHTYVPVVKWSYSRLHKKFTLILSNGGIKVVNLVQLFALAAPFVFDLEKLPLENPDEGQEGMQAVRWAKARAQVQSFRSCFWRTKASEDIPLLTKTSEKIPKSKTVAERFQSTKGTDTRHAGLSKDKDNM
ncbi:hypothetical protein E3N88_28635 [Mikania micrantha]|uniref:Uncharacterized protein n=1 Tax=Mikania micrantha TaxID=192012 RepID=A0A5N6N1L6_9ASTR|nr:hypothetical protein E3N88_28635 [Mikania micrantha]